MAEAGSSPVDPANPSKIKDLDCSGSPFDLRRRGRRSMNCATGASPKHSGFRTSAGHIVSSIPIRALPVVKGPCSSAHSAVSGTREPPAVLSSCSTARLHFGSRSQIRMRPSRSTPSVSLVTCRRHWRTNASSGHVDHEGGVVGHQPARGPHLRREEVGSHQCRPVRLHKRSPRRRALPTRWNPMRVQDARNRGTTNAVAHVLQCALNPRVDPRRILRRHPNHQRSDVCLQTRTTAAAATIRPFARHQLTMPAQDRPWRHDRCDLREQAPADPMPELRQASSLVIFEAQAPPRERSFRSRLSSRRNAIRSACSR
jgi:hypothetical protein